MSTYIDSNVFLYPIIYDETVPGVAEARAVLLRIATGELQACTASLTWDEIVWVVRRVIDAEAARTAGERFLVLPYLRVLDIDLTVIQKAQELITAYNLKPRDAIHAAAAQIHDCATIISDDRDFDSVNGLSRIPLVPVPD